MTTSLHRALLPTALLLLGACATDDVAAPAPAERLAADAARVPLLRWAPGVGAAAAYDLAVGSDGRAWAAGDVDGLFVADEGTLRWRRVATLPADVTASSVATTPDGAVYVGSTLGVWRSDDAGATWRQTGLTDGFARQLESDEKGTLYAGLQGIGGGVVRSDDGGASWRMVIGPFAGRGGIIDWISVRRSDVLVGLYAQVPMYSRDAGETWDYLTSTFELPDWSAFANHMVETDRGTLLLTWARGIARSTDGGQRFEHVFDGPNVIFLARDDASGALYAQLFDGSVLRSTDDGVTWTPRTGPFRPRGVESFTVARDGGLLLGTGSGVWRTVP